MTWQRFRKRPIEQLYYSDFVPFAHDPPGHTCGLPCCNSDLYLHLNLSHHGGCMSTPFAQVYDTDIPEENFTLRRNKVNLLIGKPVFKNEGFHSLRPGGRHGNINERENKRKQELSEAQKHFLHGRGITLPRYNVSNFNNFIRTANKRKRIPSESSSESEYEIESRQRIPQTFEHDGKPIMSRKFIQARNSFEFGIDGPYASHNQEAIDNDTDDYDIVVIHRHNETDTMSSVHESTDDDVFLAPPTEFYHNTNADYVSQLNVKHGASNQMFPSTKHQNVNNDSIGYSEKSKLSPIDNHTYTSLKHTENVTNVQCKENDIRQINSNSSLPAVSSSNVEKCSISAIQQRPMSTKTENHIQTVTKLSESSKIMPPTSKKLPPVVPPKPTREVSIQAKSSFATVSHGSRSLPRGTGLKPPLQLPTPVTQTPYDMTMDAKVQLKSALKTGSLQHNVKLSDIDEIECSMVRDPEISRKSAQDMSKAFIHGKFTEGPITLIL